MLTYSDHGLTAFQHIRTSRTGFTAHDLKSISEQAVDLIAYRGQEDGTFYVQNYKGRALIEERHGGYRYIPGQAAPFSLGSQVQARNYREELELTFNSDDPNALVQVVQVLTSKRAGDVIVSVKRL